jgi:DNA polymerase elongation subunit (family B)
MYTRLYYDRNRNKVHIWEVENGKKRHITEDLPFEYYLYPQDGEQFNDEGWKDVYGKSVYRNVVTSPSDVKNAKRLLKDFNIPTCEASIMPEMKYLYNKYGTGNLIANMDDFNIAYWDIEVEVEKGFPYPSKAEFPINAITVKFSKTGKVHTFALREYTSKNKDIDVYHWVPDEKALLEKFIKVFRKNSVDVLAGWNSLLFDMPYFVNRCRNLGIYATLSPIGEYNERFDRESGEQYYEIPGIA